MCPKCRTNERAINALSPDRQSGKLVLKADFERAFSQRRTYLGSMLIWIMALILFAIAGACGYKLGAVRFGVSLVGLIIAAALALPLAPYMRPLVGMMGMKNPLWAVVLPPLLVFLLVYAVFIGLSFFVHRKVELYYKYRTDDTQRFMWERLNRAIGLFVGLAMGVVWLLLIGAVIYGSGYLAVQLVSDDTDSAYLRFLSKGRQDLQTTGLDKAVAPLDPMPPRFYEASDILGLIYQNPILLSRLAQYPTFLLLGDRPEFQEIASDTGFNQMLLSKADAVTIAQHPKFQAIVQNSEIMNELLAQDLKDLRAYLETGISPRYEEERILGKWRLDPYATMAQERKRDPEMTSTEMRRLKHVMTEIMPTVAVVATTDKKVTIRADGVADKLTQLFNPAQVRPAVDPSQAGAAPMPQMSPDLAQRYGVAGGRGQVRPPGPAAAAPAAQKPVPIPYMVLSAQGAWEREGDSYQLRMQDERGKSETLQATADEDRLTIVTPNAVLVFAKAE